MTDVPIKQIELDDIFTTVLIPHEKELPNLVHICIPDSNVNIALTIETAAALAARLVQTIEIAQLSREALLDKIEKMSKAEIN